MSVETSAGNSQTTSVQQPSRPKAFGTLYSDVIKKDLCVACGSCVASCPVSVLTMKKVPSKDEQPALIGKCILCELCYHQCPKTDPALSELEMKVFSRARSEEESFGIYLDCHTARSMKSDVLKVASNGGVVTSILAYALKENIIDCAVVSGVSESEPWKPVPMVALNSDELMRCAGTRYTPSPTSLGLASAVQEYDKRSIAVVGTPCLIQAVRKMQTTRYGALKLGSRVVLTIGLFCMESFYYDGLVKTYLQQKGLDLRRISKFSIRKGKFIVNAGGEVAVDVPLKEVKSYATGGCHTCQDFTAELADLSVGDIGSEDGWSSVIVRTEVGKKIFEGSAKAGFIEYKPLDQVKPGLASVVKLSKLKRQPPEPAATTA